MKKCLSALALWLVVSGFSTASAQEIDSKVTCVFLYNFTKYIKWPATAETGDFVIGIVGETPIEAELVKLTSKLKVNGVRSIVVKKIAATNNSAALLGCHILYISGKANKSLKEISAAVNDAPILLVSEGMGLANKGSTISIYVDEETDKIKLELNKKSLESHKMKAASELLALVVVI
jgi:hypothetical protein